MPDSPQDFDQDFSEDSFEEFDSVYVPEAGDSFLVYDVDACYCIQNLTPGILLLLAQNLVTVLLVTSTKPTDEIPFFFEELFIEQDDQGQEQLLVAALEKAQYAIYQDLLAQNPVSWNEEPYRKYLDRNHLPLQLVQAYVPSFALYPDLRPVS